MTTGPTTLTIEEIRTNEAFRALEPHWNALLDRCDRQEIYLTFEWISSWWRCFGTKEKSLLLLVVRDGTEIVGIAPFMEQHGHLLGLPVRSIEFLSMAEYADSPSNCAASLDFIIPGRHDEVIGAIMEHLRGHAWDLLRLNPIPRSSSTAEALARTATREKLHFTKQVVYASAYINVGTDWQTYSSALSSRFRKSMRSMERKLQEQGEIGYREYTLNGNADEVFDEILAIEKRSWKWTVGVSINSVALGDFYRVFAQEASKKGWLRVWMMQVNGKNIAYDYIAGYHGRLASLKTSFDEHYREFSPGNLLTLREFQRFFEDGTKQISLTWGDILTKQRWGTELEDHDEIYVFNRGFYGRLLHILAMQCSLIRFQRIAVEYRNRLSRKLGLRLKSSELTRVDQIDSQSR